MCQITFDDMMIEWNPWTWMHTMFAPAPLMIAEDPTKTARILDYQERRAARVEGLLNAAANRRTEANRRIDAGFGKLHAIPFGQPVHGVRDRNYREKAGRQIDSGMRLDREADRFQERAEAAARNTAISSDDPMAIEKLTAKLDKLQRCQERMKEVNKAIRIKDPAKGNAVLAAMGYSADDIEKIRKPDFCGRVGYPTYALQNNNAEIRRVKSRIEDLQRKAEQDPETWTGEGWTAESDLDENRIRIYFDGKPDEETRAILKGYGFRCSPSAGAWQRQNTAAGRSAMRMLKKKLES
jgi:hypothetical protein